MTTAISMPAEYETAAGGAAPFFWAAPPAAAGPEDLRAHLARYGTGPYLAGPELIGEVRTPG